jgi:hypothetical protein
MGIIAGGLNGRLNRSGMRWVISLDALSHLVHCGSLGFERDSGLFQPDRLSEV